MAAPQHYNVGEVIPGGEKVTVVYGESEKIQVFETNNGTISHSIDEEPLSDKNREVLMKFNYLHARLIDILPKDQWNTFKAGLGTSLFYGLSATDAQKAGGAFSDVEKHIIDRAEGYNRLIYLCSALATAIVLGALLFGYYLYYPVAHHRIYALYVLFALAGALTSVMQRMSSVEVGAYEQSGNLVIRGIFRVVLGGLLAMFLVTACKANLFMGIAATTQWSYLAFAFLSGFSERFVPEMLTELEQKKSPAKPDAKKS